MNIVKHRRSLRLQDVRPGLEPLLEKSCGRAVIARFDSGHDEYILTVGDRVFVCPVLTIAAVTPCRLGLGLFQCVRGLDLWKLNRLFAEPVERLFLLRQ